MIKSIYLENWKTHLDSKLSFQKGTNILLGVIGSGKSSVVDAICYALYGTFPTLSNRKVTLDETIMFKPSKKDFFKIVLELEQDNKLYLIEREVFSGNKANSAKIYHNNKLIAGPKKSDVDAFLSNLLGIDYNLFTKVVYSQQNEIDYFLKIPPSKRKEQFDDLFGISHFDTIKVSTRELDRLLSHEQDKQELLSAQLSSQLSSFNLDSLKEDEKNLKEKIYSLQEDLSKNQLKKKELENTLKNEREKKTKYDKLSSEEALFSSRLEDVLKELKLLSTKLNKEPSLFSLDSDKKNLSLLEESLLKKQTKNKEIEIIKKSLESKLSFYRSNLSSLDLKIKQLSSSFVKLSLSFEELSFQKKQHEQTLSSLNISKATLLSKEKELEKSSEELSKGFSLCPVCLTPFTKEHLEEVLLRVSSQKATLSEEKTIVLNEILKHQSSLENLQMQEKVLEKNSLLKTQLQDLENQFLETTNLEKKNIEELSSLSPIEDLSSLEKEIKELKDSLKCEEDYLKLLSKKNEFEVNLSSLKETLSSFSYKEEDFLNLLAENKNLDFNFSSLNSSLTLSLNALEGISKNISSFESLSNQRKEVSSYLNVLSLKKQDLSYFLKAIESSQTQLRKVLIDNINQALSLIWPKVYPYKDYLSARLNADNDYILEVLTLKNNWIRVEGLLSGGERACASLSIRIAISLILTKRLGLLILDEPTHNLDEKTIEALSNILDEELPDLVDQIFIVTHDNKLLETTNASKFIVERDKENDSVSRVVF